MRDAQLGVDLSADTQPKLTWLREAVMALDPTNASVRDHSAGVLRDLDAALSEVQAHARGGESALVSFLKHIVRVHLDATGGGGGGGGGGAQRS